MIEGYLSKGPRELPPNGCSRRVSCGVVEETVGHSVPSLGRVGSDLDRGLERVGLPREVGLERVWLSSQRGIVTISI